MSSPEYESEHDLARGEKLETAPNGVVTPPANPPEARTPEELAKAETEEIGHTAAEVDAAIRFLNKVANGETPFNPEDGNVRIRVGTYAEAVT